MNKGIEFVKLHTIFKDVSLQHTLPIAKTMLRPVVVTYCYKPPISRTIFNYTPVLKQIKAQNLKKCFSEPCDRQNAKFWYTPVGHVISDDLDLI